MRRTSHAPAARWTLAALVALAVAGIATDIAGFNLFAYAPPKPQGVTATLGFVGADNVIVKWYPIGLPVTYRVYRSDSLDGVYTLRTSTAATSYTEFVGCGNGSFYYYVVSYDGAQESEPSDKVQGGDSACFADTPCADISFSGPPVSIPDPGAINSSIGFTAMATVDTVELHVAIEHSYVGDIVLTLVSPNGTQVKILNGTLGGDNRDLKDTVFSDDAQAAFSTGTSSYIGTFLPLEPLSAFQGENAFGQWTLSVADDEAVDQGSLMAWSLKICTAIPPEDGIQTADINGDHIFSLSELLRIIQFYNIGGYHCSDNPGDTEDGLVPGAGLNQSCAPHDTDYLPQDWIIVLSELLRAIQFYNSGGYNYCPGNATEDGFCPGL